MAISKIKILDDVYDITVPALEEKIGDLTRRLDVIETKNEDIYYQGSYIATREAIIDIIERLDSIEHTAYATMAEVYDIIDQLRSETKATVENPKQKFDLEIFEVIETSNPFLQNLK